MALWCRHEWALLDKTILPSAWEQLTASNDINRINKASAEMFEKTLVLTLTCKHCGKLRIDKTRNPA